MVDRTISFPLAASHLGIPGYWEHETSGVLRPAVTAYLRGDAMTPDHVAAMRAYLRQWIAGGWVSADGEVAELRASVDRERLAEQAVNRLTKQPRKPPVRR